MFFFFTILTFSLKRKTDFCIIFIVDSILVSYKNQFPLHIKLIIKTKIFSNKFIFKLLSFFHLISKNHSVIVDRIDDNKDSFVDMAELKNWISFTQRRYIEDDVNRQWKQHNPDNAEKLHWEVSL